MRCIAESCDRPAQYKKAGLCQKHYFRLRRNGTTETKSRSVKPRIVTPNGYVSIYAPEHPLCSGKHPRVFEHRLVMFADIGFSPISCEICSAPESWSTCHVDHKDDNRQNNDRSNLRITCRGCNTSRSKRATTAIYEHNGVRLSAADWAKQPGVNVTAHHLRVRISLGMPIEQALYEPNKTHKKPREFYKAEASRLEKAKRGQTDRKPQAKTQTVHELEEQL